MARATRRMGRRTARPPVVSADPPGTDTFGQVARFETANGMPSGPLAILLAFVLALLVYPITRLVRAARRR